MEATGGTAGAPCDGGAQRAAAGAAPRQGERADAAVLRPAPWRRVLAVDERRAERVGGLHARGAARGAGWGAGAPAAEWTQPRPQGPAKSSLQAPGTTRGTLAHC